MMAFLFSDHVVINVLSFSDPCFDKLPIPPRDLSRAFLIVWLIKRLYMINMLFYFLKHFFWACDHIIYPKETRFLKNHKPWDIVWHCTESYEISNEYEYGNEWRRSVVIHGRFTTKAKEFRYFLMIIIHDGCSFKYHLIEHLTGEYKWNNENKKTKYFNLQRKK